MWRAYNEFGFLEYSFVETVEAKHISYIIRAFGGLLYFTGAVLMTFNLIMTALGRGEARTETQKSPAGLKTEPALMPAE